MKLTFKTDRIASNPQKAFQIMEAKITKGLKNKETIDESSLYAEIQSLNEAFTQKRDRVGMYKNFRRLAETLVNLGNGNLAGIIYSSMIKLNKNNYVMVEEMAASALKIAKRFNDDVHIMARADDLVRIYSKNEFGSDRHIKMLYTEKHALNNICKNYEGAKTKYKVISREIKPRETYEHMLAGIKINIAEVIMRKKPHDAITELTEAEQILQKYGEGPQLEKIRNLLKKLG